MSLYISGKKFGNDILTIYVFRAEKAFQSL